MQKRLFRNKFYVPFLKKYFKLSDIKLMDYVPRFCLQIVTEACKKQNEMIHFANCHSSRAEVRFKERKV